MPETFLSVKNIRKAFANNTVVQDFDLDVERGEFVSFLGPSGCGKTTVLRMIAGFEEPTAGSIVIGGKDVTRLKPNQRNIGMVFQAYAMFPNLTVAQNIGANRAYEPAALAIIAFAITWGCMSVIQFLARYAPKSANRPN